jgi:hypothetical protein
VKKAKDQPESEPASLVGERIGKIRKEGGVISSTFPSTSTLRRTLKGMMQQPAEKTGGKHSFLKMV